jgi:hypothetical protein
MNADRMDSSDERPIGRTLGVARAADVLAVDHSGDRRSGEARDIGRL